MDVYQIQKYSLLKCVNDYADNNAFWKMSQATSRRYFMVLYGKLALMRLVDVRQLISRGRGVGRQYTAAALAAAAAATADPAASAQYALAEPSRPWVYMFWWEQRILSGRMAKFTGTNWLFWWAANTGVLAEWLSGTCTHGLSRKLRSK